MLLNNVPAVLLALAALVAPGVVWAWRCYPSGSRLTRLAVGLALGVAFQMHVCALLALGPRITRASVWGATLAALALAALLAWRWPRRISSPGAAWRRALRQGAQVGVVVVVMAAIWTIPLAYHLLPQGWDPSLHSLLASVTVQTGRLPTWRPFEPINSNYPYGTHVIIAEISLLTGLAPHQVFGPLLNTAIPLLTGLAVYCFARRVWGRQLPALGAVVAYGFLGNWGAIDYGAWGGLPNAMGFFLLLVFLVVLFAPGAFWMRVVVGGALLGAIPLAHNHVMLTAAMLLGVYAVFLLARMTPTVIDMWRQRAALVKSPPGWRAIYAGAMRTQTGRAFVRLALTPYGPPPAGFARAQWNANHTAFTLTLPSLTDAWMSCQAQVGATVALRLDGRPANSFCNGLAVNIPALAGRGLHRFVGRLAHMTQRGGSSRWFDLLLFTRHV